MPASLPALLHARKVQRRADAVGYDWPDLAGPFAKLREELAELEEASARVGAPAPETEPDPEVHEAILERVRTVVPELAGARVLGARVGLRPVAPAVSLVAAERGGRLVVTNHGHGGAGVTLSWGCAEEVARLVAEADPG